VHAAIDKIALGFAKDVRQKISLTLPFPEKRAFMIHGWRRKGVGCSSSSIICFD
jgi:hypothetical protein